MINILEGVKTLFFFVSFKEFEDEFFEEMLDVHSNNGNIIEESTRRLIFDKKYNRRKIKHNYLHYNKEILRNWAVIITLIGVTAAVAKFFIN